MDRSRSHGQVSPRRQVHAHWGRREKERVKRLLRLLSGDRGRAFAPRRPPPPGARLPPVGAGARGGAGRKTPRPGGPGRPNGIRWRAEAATCPGAALGRGGGGPARAAAASARPPRGGRACQAGARRGHGDRRPRRRRAGGGCLAGPPDPAALGVRRAPAASGGAG